MNGTQHNRDNINNFEDVFVIVDDCEGDSTGDDDDDEDDNGIIVCYIVTLFFLCR